MSRLVFSYFVYFCVVLSECILVPRINLNDGRRMPMLAFGTWLGNNTNGRVQSNGTEVEQAVRWAISAGYRHIDTAYSYKIEDQVGRAIAAKIAEGVVKRDELFITTKLWNSFHPRELVVGALQASLRALQLDYVDLFLIHWPVGQFPTDSAESWSLKTPICGSVRETGRSLPSIKVDEGDGCTHIVLVNGYCRRESVVKKISGVGTLLNGQPHDNGTFDLTDYAETWRGLAEARSLRLTRSIGLSNFNTSQVERLLAKGMPPPAVLQVEVNLNLQQPELLEFCRAHDIAVTGYSPFGALFPTRRPPNAPPPDVRDPPLVEMAAKYNKTVPQLVLRYLTELGVTPIPKSLQKSRIEENINIFDFNLTEDDKKTLQCYDMGWRLIPQTKWRKHPYYPFGAYNGSVI